MPQTAPAEFTTLQKRLHWIVVVLIAAQYIALDSMGRPFRQLIETGEAPYTTVTIGHIAVGVLLFALTAWRLAVRLRHGAPEAPAEEPPTFAKLAKIAHAAIYVLVLGLPISGGVAWFAGIHAVGDVHEIGTNILLTLVILHIAAVAAHQFWWKTGLIRRMT